VKGRGVKRREEEGRNEKRGGVKILGKRREETRREEKGILFDE
jgi:hypothetical protein